MARARFQKYRVVVPAGESKHYAIAGDAVHALELDGELQIEFDNDAQFTEFAQGIQYPQEPFKTFNLINNTGSEISGSILVGQGVLDDNRLSVAGTVTIQNESGGSIETDGKPATSLSSSAKATVTNAAAAAVILAANASRRCVFLRNISPAYTVYIGDANVSMTNGRGLPLAAGEAIKLGSANEPFTGEIYAHADGGADVDVTILEME